MDSWRICIDTGGTFTDCWAIPPGENVPNLVKVLSSGRLRVKMVGDSRVGIPWDVPQQFFTGWNVAANGQSATVLASDSEGRSIHRLQLSQPFSGKPPEEIDLFTGEEAPVVGARLLTGTQLGDPFPELDLRLATTRGTNALLEAKGAPTAFFVTEGFADLLAIRDQRRPDLFALEHQKTPPLYQAVVEVPERLDRHGDVLNALQLGPEFHAAVRELLDRGIRVAAIALMHSYLNPENELALAQVLREAGFEHVSLSSDLAPLIKLLPRAETAVVDAYLTPVMQQFLDRVSTVTEDLWVMTSSGGLESRTVFRAKDSLFSGPAGGVVGAAASGKSCGFDRLITFDMGGTSTDVARIDGDVAYQFQQTVGAATLLSPSLRIETVAAGGGSICQWKNHGLRVGPESAGADPGPACYGRGGPLTITDVNLLLGRIDPTNFGIPLTEENIAQSRRALRGLMEPMGPGFEETDVLEGLLRIAVEQMADSIRRISIREGADPKDYALLAFGGAGPLHACDIAAQLGMTTILIPAEAGVLSAFGLHHALIERFAERQILRPLDDCVDLETWLDELRDEAASQLGEQASIRRRIAELRILGQDSTLDLEIGELARLDADFREKYQSVFGYEPDGDQKIELVSLRVIISSPAHRDETTTPSPASSPSAANGTFIDRASLQPGDEISGPKIIQDPFSTLYLKPGWKAHVHPTGTIITTLESPEETTSFSTEPSALSASPISRELFRHRFQNMVNEMGAMLQRSAISTNVKERMDFSCALLDANGQLVANAPHIPVHLGALGLCVRKVTEAHPLNPGDMIVTNHPGFGGSHLPDVTVISPLFGVEPGGNTLRRIGYVANRAHHAEIGGIRPGSMPPNAKNLAEEGVVIPPTFLFEANQEQFPRLWKILTSGAYPTRNLHDNLADLQAQAAANVRGVAAMTALSREFGIDVILEHLEALADQSQRSFRHTLQSRPLACESAEERLDDGTVIRVSAQREGERLILDFAGTSRQSPAN